MTKLTTEITIEELQYRINAHENDLTQMWTADYFLSVQKELLALKQAAKNPIGSFHISGGQVEATTDYCRDGEWPVQDGEVLVYAAPVLPKQPELLSIGELLHRLEEQTGEKWVEESAQPVSEPYELPDGYQLCFIPMEHTEAFHDACSAAFNEFERGTGPCGVFIAGHRAMLAAAPAQESE